MFEFLVLESAQAGLSWLTILKRREGYRRAFANFDAQKVAKFSQSDIEQLMQYQEIIRNRRKIEATISNAKLFLALQKTHGSFVNYLKKFLPNGEPIVNNWQNIAEVPASTSLSDTISSDMKKQGFKFFGTTICYAYLQAVGCVNDHLVNCFCRIDNLKK